MDEGKQAKQNIRTGEEAKKPQKHQKLRRALWSVISFVLILAGVWGVNRFADKIEG